GGRAGGGGVGGLWWGGKGRGCQRSLLQSVLGFVLALAVTGLATAPALAEHEPQFRYTVVGYVKDSAGKPRQGQSLEVIRQKTGFSYVGETDAAGFYVIVNRLARESRDEGLLLRAGPGTPMVSAPLRPPHPVS